MTNRNVWPELANGANDRLGSLAASLVQKSWAAAFGNEGSLIPG